MTSVSYVVPGKPAGINRPNGRRGGRVPFGTKTAHQRAFADALAFRGLAARRKAGWETTSDPVEVWIRVVFDSRRPDTDGPVKAVLDSLEVARPHLRRPGAAFVSNDSQVETYHVSRGHDPKHPRVEVTIAKVSARRVHVHEHDEATP